MTNIGPARPLSFPVPSPLPRTDLTISVIMPVLNRVDFLARALDSLQAQDQVRLDPILVDGGSRDGTPELARSRGIKVIEGPDHNSHHAMNKGLSMATGQVVGFLNSDDVYLPHALSWVARSFADDAAVTVVRGRCLLAPAGTAPGAEPQEIFHLDDVWGQVLYGTPAFNSWFFRRDCLPLLDQSLTIAADRQLLIKILLAGHHPKILDVPVYRYDSHDGSATLANTPEKELLILAEHIRIAHGLGRQDHRVRDWGCFEAAHRFMRTKSPRDLFQAFRLWPLWPLHALRARRYLKTMDSLTGWHSG